VNGKRLKLLVEIGFANEATIAIVCAITFILKFRRLYLAELDSDFRASRLSLSGKLSDAEITAMALAPKTSLATLATSELSTPPESATTALSNCWR
jgi:hypothetical protein